MSKRTVSTRSPRAATRPIEPATTCDGSFLAACDDRLAPSTQPLCYEYFQVLKLIGVPDFDRPGKAGVLLKGAKPMAAALPTAEYIAQFFTCAALLLDATAKEDAINIDVVSNNLLAVQSTCRRPTYPLCAPVTLALAVRYRQCWVPRGYRRGDLLHSVSLWPQEELALEVFSWDRRRMEHERTAEASRELNESGTFTVRSTREILASTQFKVAAGVEGKIGAQLSLAGFELPIDVSGNVGGTFSSELTASLESKVSQLSEATRSASVGFKESRRTRVFESSELGSESRSTRRIRNANTCHVVDFRTFEIVEVVAMQTAVAGAEYVAMVPLPDVLEFSPAWLLCHEFPLRSQLLDPIYARGFDAARKIASAEIFRTMITPPPPTPVPPPVDSGPPPSTPTAQDTLRDFLQPIVQEIIDAGGRVRQAAFTNLDLANFFNPSTHAAARRKASRYGTRRLIESVFPGIFERIDTLATRMDLPGVQLYQALDLFVQQVLETGLLNVVYNPVKLEVLPLLVLPFDDRGLIGAIDYAHRQLQTLGPAVSAQVGASLLPGAGSDQTSATEAAAEPPAPATGDPIAEKVDERYALDALADAQVEMDRLICHLGDYADYYLTILFSVKGQAGVNEILAACPHAKEVVTPSLLAIQDGYAIFPLNRSEQRRRGLEQIDRTVAGLRDHRTEVCLELPTTATTTTPSVGECSACDDHARRAREAEVSRAESEAARYRQRLDADPPLLDHPSKETPPVLNVRVLRDGD